jgi:alkanesulfonate monooxygenase SsuD/methylene tetrahydromethanopterin reductase-like flavin-dependent oxidoreductase (luciferase family)
MAAPSAAWGRPGEVASDGMTARRAIFIAPFDELADPNTLAGLAEGAEPEGWDGLFVWDHVRYRAPVRGVADPWIALAAIAAATDRIRLGPLVTPLARRRIQKLARETVTLDHLSGGRLVLGVGLGSDRYGELGPFGEVVDPRERARLLDEGLARLASYWGGEFEPVPVQSPRIPVWVGARWPNRRPLRRAAHWDGLFPIDLPGPEALVELADEVSALRTEMGNDRGLDLIVDLPPGADPGPWEAAGATWILTEFGVGATEKEVREWIEEAPLSGRLI